MYIFYIRWFWPVFQVFLFFVNSFSPFGPNQILGYGMSVDKCCVCVLVIIAYIVDEVCALNFGWDFSFSHSLSWTRKYTCTSDFPRKWIKYWAKSFFKCICLRLNFCFFFLLLLLLLTVYVLCSRSGPIHIRSKWKLVKALDDGREKKQTWVNLFRLLSVFRCLFVIFFLSVVDEPNLDVRIESVLFFLYFIFFLHCNWPKMLYMKLRSFTGTFRFIYRRLRSLIWIK